MLRDNHCQSENLTKTRKQIFPTLRCEPTESRNSLHTEKNGLVTATKLGTTNKFFVAATKYFAAATKRFVDRTYILLL